MGGTPPGAGEWDERGQAAATVCRDAVRQLGAPRGQPAGPADRDGADEVLLLVVQDDGGIPVAVALGHPAGGGQVRQADRATVRRRPPGGRPGRAGDPRAGHARRPRAAGRRRRGGAVQPPTGPPPARAPGKREGLRFDEHDTQPAGPRGGGHLTAEEASADDQQRPSGLQDVGEVLAVGRPRPARHLRSGPDNRRCRCPGCRWSGCRRRSCCR